MKRQATYLLSLCNFLLSILIYLPCVGTAQYVYEKPIFRYPYPIEKISPFDQRYIKGVGKNLYIYVRQPIVTPYSFQVYKVDLEKEALVDSFYLPKFEKCGFFTDIIAGNNSSSTRFFNTGDYTYFIKDSAVTTESEWVYFDQDRTAGSKVSAINDSLYLSYVFYDFHPKDGGTGLQLNIYNTSQRRITKSRTYRTPGIIAAPLVIEWAVATQDYLYSFAGLSFRGYKYDLNLNLVDSFSINGLVDAEELKQNLEYEKKTDKYIYHGHDTLLHTLLALEKDSTLKDNSADINIYKNAKDNISLSIQSLRSSKTFIEKARKLNNDLILLSVSRPGYQMEFRDVYWYQPSTNTIVKKAIKWRTGKKQQGNEIIEKVEDYFPVDIITVPTFAPYFYHGAVYKVNIFNPETFKLCKENNTICTKEIFDEQLFKQAKTHGYQWQISKYIVE